MQQYKDVNERIRPLLRAMERSIEKARRQRTQVDEPAPDPSRTPADPQAATARPAERTSGEALRNDEAAPQSDGSFDPTRMKARPKRRLAS